MRDARDIPAPPQVPQLRADEHFHVDEHHAGERHLLVFDDEIRVDDAAPVLRRLAGDARQLVPAKLLRHGFQQVEEVLKAEVLHAGVALLLHELLRALPLVIPVQGRRQVAPILQGDQARDEIVQRQRARGRDLLVDVLRNVAANVVGIVDVLRFDESVLEPFAARVDVRPLGDLQDNERGHHGANLSCSPLRRQRRPLGGNHAAVAADRRRSHPSPPRTA
mmetsp:Transcript_35143/g.110632  ORF Transcript_35143/g.110632 Transcript_35143/m.110632 type:complete len:221 (+) Transcript_35143:2115-2777(+)